MTTAAPTMSQEVNTFEEYTLYSLEQSTPGLLRLMERSKQVATFWPGVLALTEAASVCQELAALACYQGTLTDVFRIQDCEGELGEKWQRMQRKMEIVMDNMDDVLNLNDAGATRKLFGEALPDALNLFLDLIPLVSEHIRADYPLAEIGTDDPSIPGM